MLRVIVYAAIVLNVIYGVVFLVNRKFRTRELLWVPFFNLGVAIEAVAFLLGPPYKTMAFFLGGVVVIIGILASRKPRMNGVPGS
ncbi:MAG TPA: hypothetical protein VF021_00780 [Longimicrobiales bacterium]